MKKRLLSILLAACMVFSAGQSAVYAADTPDQAKENAILSENGETQQSIENIQEEGIAEKTAASVSEDTLASEIIGTDLDENLTGYGEIPEERAIDREDLLEKYRELAARHYDRFRIILPLEVKVNDIKDFTPESIMFNDSDPDSWSYSECFTPLEYYADQHEYNEYGTSYEDDRVVMNIRNVITYHMSSNHPADPLYIIVTFPRRIPDGVEIEIDGNPAQLNDERTAAKALWNEQLEAFDLVQKEINIAFIGLLPPEVLSWHSNDILQWLYITDDIFTHTGIPDQGDYLYSQTRSRSVSDAEPVLIGSTENSLLYDLPFDFWMSFYSTAEMEDQVAVKIDEVLDDLALDGKSDYEKIKAIHDFICVNTTYEKDQDDDVPPLIKHSAYSALINQKAVCEGYATLFYRMCLRSGIDVRIITGKGKSEAHAWNIVKIGSYWYDVDTTWDEGYANVPSTEYFLIPHSEFLLDHTPDRKYTEKGFVNDHPMSEIRYCPPSFEKASLILGGKIGLNMMMNLPQLPEFDYDNSYMEFTVNGGEPIRQDYDPNRTNEDGTLFKFTCYVNSVQMADDITAVFHYLENGEEKQVSQTYTVEQYLKSLSILGETAEAKALAKATGDYGYYIQPYLAEFNNWALEGEDAAHKRMSFRNSSGYLNKISEILDGIDSPDINKTSDIRSLGISLLLDSDTSLNLLIYTNKDYTGTVQAAINNKDVEAKKISKGKYKVVIPNIGAASLDKKYSVVVTTDAGDTTINLSALNYVKIALSKTNPEATYNEKQAMGAIYYYAKAAKAYAAAQLDA